MSKDLKIEKEFVANLDALIRISADRVYARHSKGLPREELLKLKDELITLEEKAQYLHALMIQDSKATTKGRSNAVLRITLKMENGGRMELTLDELVALHKCLIGINNDAAPSSVFMKEWPLPEPLPEDNYPARPDETQEFQTNPCEKESKVNLNPKGHPMRRHNEELNHTTVDDLWAPNSVVSNPQCFKAWLATKNYIKNKGVKK